MADIFSIFAYNGNWFEIESIMDEPFIEEDNG